ncbi:MAG: hypothetical protein ACLTQE_14435 [Proteus mirabilis]|uniref:hypothetical protein n=1 Tax=Proteus mirabilis TaxID=584 RepID=UPI0027EB79D1|nr:hypothetical protein [Proteus mirabilis]
MIKKCKRVLLAGSIAVASILSAPLAIADTTTTTKPDYTQITGSVDFADVGVAIMAIAVAVAGLYVCVNGVKKLTAFLRSA